MKTAMVFLLLVIAPVWAATKPVPASPSPAALSQQEQNKAVARRFFEEIFNQGRFEVADELYAKGFVNHGLHSNADQAEDQAAARFEKQACPDLNITIGPIVAEGDLVSVLWVARGTNTARVGWMPATGTRIEAKGITIWRFTDGKIHDEWSSFNELSIVRQIAYHLRWLLLGVFCVALFLLWVVYWVIGKLFIRRSWHARAWDSRK